ncbi:MAG TPA: DAK2 domain-containing protein [Cellulomonas sp.]
MSEGLRDGLVVRAWSRRAVLAMDAARERIDAVNVFPVADADTGTNVLLTLRGGAEAVEGLPEGVDAGTALAALARGVLLSARGSSGMILSRYLGVLAGSVASGAGLGSALAAAASGARDAVQDPQEGTVLTLAVAVGEAAGDRAGSREPSGATGDADALAAGLAAGHAALDPISAVHPVLRSARVVDAGSCALLVVLDALADVLAGRTGAPVLGWLPETDVAGTATGRIDPSVVPPDAVRSSSGSPTGERASVAPLTPAAAASWTPTGTRTGGAGAGRPAADAPGPVPTAPGAVEVMAVVPDGTAASSDLGDRLAVLGDAVVVVAGTDDAGRPVRHAHVHTTQVDAVLDLLAASGASALRVHDLAGTRSGAVACTTRSSVVGPLARTGAVVLVLDPAGTAGLPGPAALAPLLGRAVHDAAGGTGPLPSVPSSVVAEVHRLLPLGGGARVERPATGAALRVTALDDVPQAASQQDTRQQETLSWSAPPQDAPPRTDDRPRTGEEPA